MGTSVSQASRSSTNWAIVQATYSNGAFPVERVVSEVWRAAQADSDSDWYEMLSSGIVANCLEITTQAESAPQAMSIAGRWIALEASASLAAEIAQRAIVQSFRANDRDLAFRLAVFAEATDYLVSRDLSGFVGNESRNRTIGDMLEFKTNLRNRVANVVGNVGLGQLSQDNWSDYVRTVLRNLSSTDS